MLDMANLKTSEIYDAFVAIGAEMDNHASDLYVKKTPEVDALLVNYTGHYSHFISDIDDTVWYEFSFAYTPWWKIRQS